jgi:hypothetical protein
MPQSSGNEPRRTCGIKNPVNFADSGVFGYGAGMDVAFECRDCGILRSGRCRLNPEHEVMAFDEEYLRGLWNEICSD